MNVSIGDVYLEVVDNAVILTLPSKYTLKIEQAKYDKDIFMSDDLNRYAKHLHNNGGTGLQFNSVDNYKLSSYNIPVGGEIHLPFHKIHSVSCSKGTMWIVQEQGFSTKESVVLGTPFTTDGLYNTPKQFQTNECFN